MDQPSRLRPGLPGPPDRVVRAARAQLRALRDALGEPADRHAPRFPRPLARGRALVNPLPVRAVVPVPVLPVDLAAVEHDLEMVEVDVPAGDHLALVVLR